MNRFSIFLILGIFLSACDARHETTQTVSGKKRALLEISDFYSQPETKMIYSPSVADSFRIFSSLPQKYGRDTISTYPLILILDANGYFESIVSEIKLATLTQGFPKSIVIGIGYRDFLTMDSLRDRDYTFPVAPPKDEFKISGGAQKFKKFINAELLPKILREYSVDQKQIILLGHSLGGYFVLYYMLDSFENNDFPITNFISASPSLSYGNSYLFQLARKINFSKSKSSLKLYLSMGSLEQDTTQDDHSFADFTTQLAIHHPPGAQFKFVEFGNFDHMDAAMPGFIKGLIFVFEK